MNPRLLTIALFVLLASINPAFADDEAKDDSKSGEDTTVVTQHSITLNGKPLRYTATTGTVPLLEEDGDAKANVFFIAYTLDEHKDNPSRPITFCFNGGPGSSSVWLHLGMLGPRRVVMGDAGNLLGPPWSLEDSQGTILDLTDLVFIDPVTTGYSRAVPGEDDGQFHGVNEDVQSVGEFIRLFCTRYERWASPKFLAGESYGTTRAAHLANHLQDRHGMFISGVVLISAILDFQTARFNVGNDLPYLLFLPTMTATAHYHKRLPADLQSKALREVLNEVEHFALNDYALALLAGDNLDLATADRIAASLARYTGLDQTFIERANLRVSQGRFCKELLRDKRRTVGRLDSRFLGIDRDAAGESYSYDPSYSAILGPFTAMMNDYARTTLGYESDLPYEILTGRVRPWNYRSYTNRYLNVAEPLRQAMTENPNLHAFIASGYNDFATPYFATDYTFSHLGLDPSLRDHVSIRYYEAGHMMYIHEPSMRALKNDLAKFYREALD